MDAIISLKKEPKISDENNKRKRDQGTSTDSPPPKKIIIKRYNTFEELLKDISNPGGPSFSDEEPDPPDGSNDGSDSDSDDENKELVLIKNKITTLDDLIQLGKTYDRTKRYTFDMKCLNKMIEPLEGLKKMIGMKLVKKNIVDHILFYLQKLDVGLNDMLHTVIQGPPGTGKTELGKILSKIYLAMGILQNDTFKVVKRADLIGKYLGHTAQKTQKVIDSCKGGVMFIDEAYSLGNSEGRDIYSKECLDTLNQNLTENKNNFLCIIAGYKDDLTNCFFNYNKGLGRRFSIRYTIEGYDSKELYQIFCKIVKENKWNVDESVTDKFFEGKKDNFPYFGGDMETLFFNCKIVHGRRIFGRESNLKKNITLEDVKAGFELFIKNRPEKTESTVWKDLYL
jgi:SpoVK/Ycf46/Vps4 family AAA+-type ATPase